MENKNNMLENDVAEAAVNDMIDETETEPAVLVLEGENPEETEATETTRTTYMPRFTEVSEKYRRQGDAKIRERLGIKSIPEKEESDNPDEIKLDPTAEFEADALGSADAKEPENVAVDESDESINVMKFKSPEDELEEEAEREREAIKKLLGDSKPKAEPDPVEEPVEEVIEEEVVEEPVEEIKEYTIPDPDDSDFEVVDFGKDNDSKTAASTPASDNKSSKKKLKDREFNHPAQRDSIKDSFLDSLISIKIRSVAATVFTVIMLVLEILAAANVITGKMFPSPNLSNATLGLVDLLLSACILLMLIPELFRSVKLMFSKKLTPDFLPIPAFILLGLYTLTIYLTGEEKYILFGLLFALSCLPVVSAALYRTKADFIAFKKISVLEEKQVIDVKNTRELDVENKALDGVVDEYKSKIARTFGASFISDFFKNCGSVYSSPKHIAIIYGVPFGAALISGVIAFFLTWSFATAMAVLCFVALIGCPVFAILATKSSYFYSQRAALAVDSTAIGEDALDQFSAVDVFAFDDMDIFGQDDVNLKRFMLYGDRGNMDKVMRHMCALFAAVGGPLDGMFSEIIDNRVRHKTATNVIIEDDGICGDVAGHQVCVGSQEYMNRNGIAIPSAAVSKENGMSFETIKVMYAAEDGEVNAKFYIRYSFSEEFTMMIPAMRDAGIIPLIYTRDPNISNELLSTLTAGGADMRVVKLYSLDEEATVVESRAQAKMITYGDKLDAAGMIVLAKKSHKLSLHVRFAELCAMGFGVVMAVGLSIFGLGAFTPLVAALWQILSCFIMRLITKSVFLRENKKKDEE